MVAFINPTFEHEKNLREQGVTIIAGVDEAGAGCWAGPVYAGAVILPMDCEIPLLRDSKMLSEKQRNEVIIEIKEKAIAWSAGYATAKEIDEMNIRVAGFLAMKRALNGLNVEVSFVLVDGCKIPDLGIPQRMVLQGDKHVASIAAGSIVAKVTRDTLLKELDEKYPGYGFAKRKGYGTKVHSEALDRLGPTEIHRFSYAPVKKVVDRISA